MKHILICRTKRVSCIDRKRAASGQALVEYALIILFIWFIFAWVIRANTVYQKAQEGHNIARYKIFKALSRMDLEWGSYQNDYHGVNWVGSRITEPDLATVYPSGPRQATINVLMSFGVPVTTPGSNRGFANLPVSGRISYDLILNGAQGFQPGGCGISFSGIGITDENVFNRCADIIARRNISESTKKSQWLATTRRKIY